MIGRGIDRMVGVFAPKAALHRTAARQALEMARGYDIAKPDKRRGGWRKVGGSADSHVAGKLDRINGRVRDLTRNNKYADTALRQMTAAAWGDGIAPMFEHDDAAFAKMVQDWWDSWAESPVSGVHDFYGHGKLSVRGLYQDGNSLTIWRPANGQPDGRMLGRPIDHLDTAKNIARTANGVRTISGIELDDDDVRSAYWLFRDHPSGVLAGRSFVSERIEGRDVDHLFEALEHGQQIGVSRFAARAQTLIDIADIEDARRMAEKVAACVALVMIKPSNERGTMNSDQGGEDSLASSNDRPQPTSLRPGAIIEAEHGTNVHTVAPAPSSSGVELIRQQLAAVSAATVPYHVLTGDVSQANYSGLRASLLTQMALLDDDQQNTIIPQKVAPAVRRRLAVLAMTLGDVEREKIKALQITYALPIRRHADPVKDLMAEVMEVRAGFKTLSRSLADRGLNSNDHLRQIHSIGKLIDELKLALETDPRRINGSGAYQKAADAVFGAAAKTDASN